MIVGMNHFSVVADNERQTLDFYFGLLGLLGLLGLTVGYCPALGFPGAWLYAGGAQAVLHLYFERPMPATRTGVIDHLAFSATGLAVVKAPRPASTPRASSTTCAGKPARSPGSCSAPIRMAPKSSSTSIRPRRCRAGRGASARRRCGRVRASLAGCAVRLGDLRNSAGGRRNSAHRRAVAGQQLAAPWPLVRRGSSRGS